jgi:hypothetical protein
MRSIILRSQRFERWEPLEEAFHDELENFDRELAWSRIADSENKERLQALIDASRRYIDELNKVRKYACPLSTSMLLGSLMETVFNYVCEAQPVKARQTPTWKNWENKNKNRNEAIPLALLIGVIDDMKLLRTQGITRAIFDLWGKWWISRYPLSELSGQSRGYEIPSRDARINSLRLHRLREWRNAVHPIKLIEHGKAKAKADEYIDVMFDGLALLLLLETILDFKTKYPIAEGDSL